MIKLFIENGIWMSQDNDQETFELFGTNTLPTPFFASMPAETVLQKIKALNPDKKVILC